MPPRLNAANFAHSTLSSAINDSSDTDIPVVSGAVFPNPPFRALIREGATREIVEIQEVDGNTLKCLSMDNRGLEETSAESFGVGAIVENVFTAEVHQELADDTHVHGDITNDGKVGSTANLNVVTGTGGALTTETPAPRKNLIINGNLDIWQRGTSFTFIGTLFPNYTADRWVGFRETSTCTTTRQPFTPGQTDVPGEPKYYIQSEVVTGGESTSRVQIMNRIESSRTLAGKTCTLSFYAKADGNKNLSVEFIQIFGTGGSPSSEVLAIGVTKFALTTNWQKFTTTVSIPSISGKTLGTTDDGYLAVNFWLDAGSANDARTDSLGNQSGTFDIAQIQLEEGSYATPFEYRPIGEELMLCQRYFEKNYNLDTPPGSDMSGYAPGADSFIPLGGDCTVGDYVRATSTFKTTKRVTPTLTIYDIVGDSGKVSVANANTDLTSVSPHISMPSQTGLWLQAASVAVANRGILFYYTADAEL